MRVAIGSDHAGFKLKTFLLEHLDGDIDIIDCGPHSEESVDYPDFARAVCEKVANGGADKGILICGTGIGISIAANKMHGIRAALCHTEFSARMARQHNDANVLALGGFVLGQNLAHEITRVFLEEGFSGDRRHCRRIEKISDIERSRS